MDAESKALRDRRIIRAFVLGAIALFLIYLVSPETGNRFAKLKAPQDRKPMPEFAMPVLGGGKWSLAERKGKVVLVNFWATWCGPCREETPGFVKLSNAYQSSGFEIAGISMDDDPKRVVPDFLEEFDVDYPILLPPAESALAAGISSLPTSFLLDRQGRVARTYVGAVREPALERDIKALLAE